MKIGVDVDEVVVEFFRKYLELFNQRFKKKMTFEEMVNYRIWDLTDISKEESLILAHEVHNSEHLGNVDLVEGVEEALNKISKKYQIYFITSRSEKFKKTTAQTLKNIFKDFNFSLHFSEGVWEKSKTKGEVCQELGVKTMVEDNADYALDCAKNGVRTFLLAKPWNQEYEAHKNITKVKNWEEIVTHLGIKT